MDETLAKSGEADSWRHIKVLQNFGISSSDIKKLQDMGYHTIESIAYANMALLCQPCRPHGEEPS